MLDEDISSEAACQLVEEHLPLARSIASRLGRRYYWVPKDDLYSYSLWGLTLAARAYRPERGLGFGRFAATKAAFLAIDAMRAENVIQHPARGKRRLPVCISQLPRDEEARIAEPVAEAPCDDPAALLAKKELLGRALRGLNERDRQLLLMRYSDELTFKEIGEVLHLTESGVCVRHKALIKRLRSQVDRA